MNDRYGDPSESGWMKEFGVMRVEDCFYDPIEALLILVENGTPETLCVFGIRIVHERKMR